MNQNQDSPPESCLSGPNANGLRQHQVWTINSTSFPIESTLMSASEDEDKFVRWGREEGEIQEHKRHEKRMLCFENKHDGCRGGGDEFGQEVGPWETPPSSGKALNAYSKVGFHIRGASKMMGWLQSVPKSAARQLDVRAFMVINLSSTVNARLSQGELEDSISKGIYQIRNIFLPCH